MDAATNLRAWINQQYQSFDRDYAAGNLKDWVVCVGNEAGDLDTIASSIAFAFLSSQSNPAAERRYIAAQQAKSSEFNLRPENLRVLQLTDLLDDAGIGPAKEMVFPDQVDFSKLTGYGAKYALLDHNLINQAVFGPTAEIVAVIDHHQPEAENTLYPAANPRLIQVPTGSCSSLVTTYFSSTHPSLNYPQQLADLLLTAIAIDTRNFKTTAEGGKATETDMAAKQWLWDRSQFAHPAAASLTSTSVDFSTFYKQINKLKKDVSSLSSDELLRRDFKQYTVNGWTLGISSVPVSLEEWVAEKCDGEWGKFLDGLKRFGEGKNLDMASTLTSSSEPKKKKDVAQAGGGRELVLLLAGSHQPQLSDLLVKQSPKIQSDPALLLVPYDFRDPASIASWSSQNHAFVQVLSANNPNVTRKQVAPVLTNFLEGMEPKL